MRKGIQNGDEVEALLAPRPIDRRVVLQKIKFFDRLSSSAQYLPSCAESTTRYGCLRSSQRLENRRAETFAIPLRQIIVERNLQNYRRLRVRGGGLTAATAWERRLGRCACVAAGGAGAAPGASGFLLSGDWGALDSSAMDPGTIELQKSLTISRADLNSIQLRTPQKQT